MYSRTLYPVCCYLEFNERLRADYNLESSPVESTRPGVRSKGANSC